MNILMVADDFFPSVIDSRTRILNELSKSLAKKGNNVYVLTRVQQINTGSDYHGVLDGVKIKRYQVNSRSNLALFFSSLINSSSLFNQISKEISFDLINFYQPLTAWGVNFTKMARKIPQVYTLHAPGTGSLINRWFERKIVKNCRKVIVSDESARVRAIDFHRIKDAKIEVFPVGVDTEKFSPLKNKKSLKSAFGVSPEKFVLFTLCPPVPGEGIKNLIKAMSVVVKKNPDLVLIIGAEGVLREGIKSEVNHSGLDGQIKLEGNIEVNFLPYCYRVADLFILSDIDQEGFGLIALEALSCGVPVLGAPGGKIGEILENLDKNLLFKDGTPESLAEKILEYRSSVNLLELGKKCRDFVVSNYSWKKNSEVYEKIIQRC
ncbi:MAG: glycosyltransferase family 4 protein [Candidatus Omnitrophota bacterium]